MLRQDLIYALRSFRKNPGFTAIALLTIALSIGATSAVFSVVNAVLLRPLPFAEPDRLVWVWGSWEKGTEASVSAPDLLDYRAGNKSFDHLAAMSSIPAPINLTGSLQPEQIFGVFTTADFFDTLGVKPLLGRTFVAGEDQAGNEKVAVLSYGLWQRSFGSNPNVIGTRLTLSDLSYTVIGVMPQDFSFPKKVDIWAPLPFNSPMLASRKAHFLRPIGRLKAGVPIEQAEADMKTIAARLEQQYPETNKGWTVRMLPLHEHIVGSVRSVSFILLIAVIFIMLIACANIANLLLSRAAGRQKEMAMRAALGAGRQRLLRQLFTEGVFLSLIGGLFGLLLAFAAIKLIQGLDFTNFPRIEEVSLDYVVLGFTLLISLLMGIIFSLAPAIWVTKLDVHSSLKEGSGTVAGGGRHRIRKALVVSEIALTLVLLVGAGLLLKSLTRLLSVDPGFDSKNVLTMRLVLPPAKYREQQQTISFFQQLLPRIKSLPGVESAGAVSELPFSGQRNDCFFTVEGRPVDPNTPKATANIRRVTPDYFQTMGISLLKGIQFTERDVAGAPAVVIINEPMARRDFPGEDPIGKRMVLEFGGKIPVQIIGVMQGVRHTGLVWEPQAELYIPFAQIASNEMNVVIRTSSDPMALANAARESVWQLDKDQPVSNLKTMDRFVSESVALERFVVYLFGFFAYAALILAVVGIYGVIMHSVNQRTHEIGIRMALGAQRSQIVKLVMGQGALLAVIGIVIGLIGAFAVTRVLSSLLYKVSATDPVIFVAVPLLLVAVALIASYFPARTATKLNPITALREE